MDSAIKLDSGLLICPICGTNGMGVFREWKSMLQYNNLEKPVTTYILYESVSNCICFCPCGFCEYEAPKKDKSLKEDDFSGIKSQDNLNNDASNSKKEEEEISLKDCLCCCPKCLFYTVCMIIFLVFYLVIFIFFDLINCCCGFKKSYTNLRGYIRKLKAVSTIKEIRSYNILNDVDGMTIETINKDKISICPNCKYEKDFIDFIPKSKKIIIISDDARNVQVIQNNANEIRTNSNKIMSVNFFWQEKNINYNMPCYESDEFRTLKEKLINEYPEIKNMNIYFLVNGARVEENKTMLENRIPSGSTIIIDENISTSNSDQIIH